MKQTPEELIAAAILRDPRQLRSEIMLALAGLKGQHEIKMQQIYDAVMTEGLDTEEGLLCFAQWKADLEAIKTVCELVHQIGCGYEPPSAEAANAHVEKFKMARVRDQVEGVMGKGAD